MDVDLLNINDLETVERWIRRYAAEHTAEKAARHCAPVLRGMLRVDPDNILLKSMLRETMLMSMESPTTVTTPSWEDLGIYPDGYVPEDEPFKEIGGGRLTHTEAFHTSRLQFDRETLVGTEVRQVVHVPSAYADREDAVEVAREFWKAQSGDTMPEDQAWQDTYMRDWEYGLLEEDNLDNVFKQGFHQPAPAWIFRWADRTIEYAGPSGALERAVEIWKRNRGGESDWEWRLIILYLYGWFDHDVVTEFFVEKDCQPWIDTHVYDLLIEEGIDWHERARDEGGEDEIIQAERISAQFLEELEQHFKDDYESASQLLEKPWAASPAYNMARIVAITNGLSTQEVRDVAWDAYQKERKARAPKVHGHPVYKKTWAPKKVLATELSRDGIRTDKGGIVSWRQARQMMVNGVLEFATNELLNRTSTVLDAMGV
jgi:hypothetical protein